VLRQAALNESGGAERGDEAPDRKAGAAPAEDGVQSGHCQPERIESDQGWQHHGIKNGPLHVARAHVDGDERRNGDAGTRTTA
jgi:hypothetical protein